MCVALLYINCATYTKYKSSCVFPMCAHLSGSAVFLIDEEDDFNAIKIAMTWKIRKEFKNPQK